MTAPPLERRLFGTDGVRGEAGTKLSADLALALGRAAAHVSPAPRPRVLIVRDTRESGPMLEAALAAGVAAAGGDAVLGGVLPTPGAALLVRRHAYDLAAVVSASHNPYRDNGIKFFGPQGTKLEDDAEAEVERRVAEPPAFESAGGVEEVHGVEDDYLGALEERFGDLDLRGRRILLDCAHGATYRAAPRVFARLGADVTAVAVEPDGRNINHGVGSTHVERRAAQVREGGFDLGFAFDGDGDRVLAVDRHGEVVDGDELIALAAVHLRRAGRLPGNGVAVTVMTNYGFHQAMESQGIAVAVTPVGDRHVLQELLRRGWGLGGEQSGHVIETGFVPSGDGIATALLTLEALAGRDLAERGAMQKLPQRLVNVPVSDGRTLDDAPAVREAVARESAALAGRGRVLVRPSGTEPLVRVMVEAPEIGECEQVLGRLVEAVRKDLG